LHSAGSGKAVRVHRGQQKPSHRNLGGTLFVFQHAALGAWQRRGGRRGGAFRDPAQKCDPSGLRLAVLWNAREFIQAPTKMVQMYQYQKIWREIWTDGRPPPKNAGSDEANAPDPRYYGYSVGHRQDD
jgi:hypothetical protein